MRTLHPGPQPEKPCTGATKDQVLEYIAHAAVPTGDDPMHVVLEFQELAQRALGIDDDPAKMDAVMRDCPL